MNYKIFLSWTVCLLALSNLPIWADEIKCDSPYSGTLNFEAIKKIVTQCNIRSVEKLLPLLPEEYRSHYILVRNSRSLQVASDMQPRVVFTGDDAQFMLSFSGATQGSGSQTIEMLEWDPKEKRFSPHAIDFSQAHNQTLKPSDFVHDHPTECATCHRSDIRPNWDAYALWPGMYGAEDDAIKVGSPEDRAFRAFLKSVKENPGRYANLKKLPKLEDLPTKDGETYRPSIFNREESVNGRGFNFYFNQNLLYLNFERIIRKMKESPGGFNSLKYAVLGSLLECDDFTGFFSKSELDRFQSTTKKNYSDIAKETLAYHRAYQLKTHLRHANIEGDATRVDALKSSEGLSDKEFSELVDDYNPEYRLPDVNLRFLNLMNGVDNEDWYLTKDSRAYDFHYDRNHTNYMFMAKLLPEIFITDPDLKPFFRFSSLLYQKRNYDDAKLAERRNKPKVCKMLKERSIKARSDWKQLQLLMSDKRKGTNPTNH